MPNQRPAGDDEAGGQRDLGQVAEDEGIKTPRQERLVPAQQSAEPEDAEGEAGLRGASPGDLYIFLTIKPHRLFQRDGANIYCQVPIPMTTAALGGHVEVPSIDGARARVNIPAGAQSGQQFRLKGKGMKVLRSNARGDMFIEIGVETPVNLTKHQQELLAEFQEAGKGKKTNPESESFFARVKEFWEDLTE